MLMVIFGAGASYDSVSHYPPTHRHEARPPLANELFDTRPLFEATAKQFGACRQIIPVLRKPGVVVERELARFQRQAETYRHTLRELAAIRFYLRHALWHCTGQWANFHGGTTNYGTLLREVERWRVESKEDAVCFVTFNYDLMLDESMREFLNLRFDQMGSYCSGSAYMLVKLHGSINWAREIDTPLKVNSTALDVINEAPRLEISKRYTVIKDPNEMQQDGVALYPAVSIPVERKDEFSCPIEHTQALEQVLPKVTKIVTIGWRATELEFLQLLGSALKEKDPELFVVSGNDEGANETLKNLKAYLQPFGATTSTDGFSGLIYNLETFENFLRQRPP